MSEENELKAELQGVKLALRELEIERDKGLIDIGRYLRLKKEYETRKAKLEELDNLARIFKRLPITCPIPAGSFWMGSLRDDPEAHENEKPRRKLYLSEYQIGRYPVTNAQYADFVLASEHPAPEHWPQGKIPVNLDDHPVVNVSYEDAADYCRWLNQITGMGYRLPTEEEWEKAARGELPSTHHYPWGEKWGPGFCNTQELERNGTNSIYEFEQVNQSSFGVADMAGNVWEWTASSYTPYPNSAYQSLHFKRSWVVRGGSWRNSWRQARISGRGRYTPATRRSYLGFRIAMDVDTQAVDTTLVEKSPAPVNRVKLRRNLVEHFNDSELRTLCFDLDVNYDALAGLGTVDKARELIAYLERRGRISELVETCQRLRPHVTW
jgi:formylglycine-generating enzyme required for sulfatase activity